jgi:PTS system ascorbate-specific IIA component
VIGQVPPLPLDAVEVGATVADWREAVRLAGALLERSGATRPDYADDMIRMIEQHGPYVVIAPGLALAHARPGPAVLADGLSIVTLATPVPFGHPHHDPVRIVVGLAVAAPTGHITAVAGLANVLDHADTIALLAEAESPEQVLEIMDRR